MKSNLRIKAELWALRGMVGVQSRKCPKKAGPQPGYTVKTLELHFYTAELMRPNHTSIPNLRKSRVHGFVSKDGIVL